MLILCGDSSCSSLTLSLEPAIPSEMGLLYPNSAPENPHWTDVSYVSILNKPLESEGQNIPGLGYMSTT